MGVLDIDLRAAIFALAAIFAVAVGLRVYLGWAQRNDARRAEKVLAALSKEVAKRGADDAAQGTHRGSHDG